MDYDEKKGEIQVTYETVHKLSEQMCREIQSSGWQPDMIIAIACGGWLPARLFKNYLGVDAYSLGMSYYNEDNERQEKPRVTQKLEGLESGLEGKVILIVDEVDDTRGTLLKAIEEIKRRHKPAEIRLAVLCQKQKDKEGEFPEDLVVYVGKVIADKWVDYPWEAKDIDLHYRMAHETGL